ncbi:MAG: acyl-CoA dehydrogenase family protein [Phycisphaerae bacterium]|nr:acyl-CoA dehydrogenase family protein [Phycisphaerae bacterium]MCZ2399850.1 acyl-CoA dehydrogenase family protein [Phycisphaerae bacterium]NUQ48483.1 acyl-CoA dehydrogenase family protein [Phycisphaerae bacterium]
MDFRLDDDQLQLREALRTFCDNEIAPGAEAREHAGRFEDGLIAQLAGMGLFGLYVPTEYGGAGLDVVSYVMAVEELSRACASTGILMSAHHSLCVDPILTFGTPAQKQRYLPRLASGEWIGCFSLTEPGSGSDAGAARCTAVERSDGWHVTGTKCFVTNGLEAQVIILFAVTDGADQGTGESRQSTGQKKKLSAFIVDKDSPGLRIGKVEKKMGLKASSTAELVFDDCLVPKENLLGERGRGLKVALTTLNGGRLGVAAQAVGISQAALDAAVAYAKTRRQFDQPIANFQAIQWKLADMQTQIQAARLLMYRGAWLKHRMRPYEAEASMAKLLASEVSSRVTNMAVQVFGGYGYIADYPAERYLRDAKVTELYEGTSEIQRLVIARKLVSEPDWVTR